MTEQVIIMDLPVYQDRGLCFGLPGMSDLENVTPRAGPNFLQINLRTVHA